MPKKHTPGFKTAKPQAAPHSSLTSRSDFAGESHAKAKTVNERLQELRISQGPRTTSSSGLQPPLPESGDAQRQRRNHSRIAGPPPPRSWTSSRSVTRARQPQGLASSRYAHGNTQVEQISDYRPDNFLAPPLMPNQPLPQVRSLRATALRAVAWNLSWHITCQQDWLDFVLTARIKCELVAAIALWPIWTSRRLSKRNMRYLFGPQQDSYGRWSSGGEGVTHLSFGTELRQQHDYMDLAQYLKQETPGTDNTIPDSWDETDALEKADHQWSDSLTSVSDSDPDTDGQLVLRSVPPSLPFLPSLTHLSLARPYSPCWPSLLEIGSLDALCHLTHLDLSYWPAPTLIASIHDSRYPLPHTASTTINVLEDTEREIIRVFNQLGKTCRKLVWLGLEGCESWLPSLMSIHHNTIQGSRSRYDIAGSSTKTTVIKADWTGVWRGLETLKVAQSWIPQAFKPQEENSNHPHREEDIAMFRQWWTSEQRLRAEELQITRWRLEAKQPALKFEKTPIESWVELEIRSLSDREVLKYWKGFNPDDIEW